MGAWLKRAAGALVEATKATGRALRVAPSYVRHPSKARRSLRDSAFRRSLDPRVTTWEEQINRAYSARDWAKVVELVRAVMRITGAIDTPEIRLKLINSHIHLRQFDAVDRQLERSLRRHPDSEVLLQAQAEHAMASCDFGMALSAWQKSARMSRIPAVVDGQVRGFPVRGSVFDWYEYAWIQCVEHWETWWGTLGERPSASMYQRVIQTLLSAGELRHAKALSLVALEEHPRSVELSVQASETLVRNSPDVGAARLVETLVGTKNNSVAKKVARDLDRAATILDDIKALGPTGSEELRILTAYRLSGADFLIRTSNFWDERRIHDEALRLAKRDRWPEQTAETDLVSAKAWAEARAFAASRAKEVGVSPPALARAVFHYFKQELTQKIPVDRIAAEIARTRKSEPVFIDLGPVKIPYMVSYPTGRMQTLYFYDALRKHGCNVTLARFPRRPQASPKRRWRRPPQLTPMPVISLVPQPAQLRPPARPLKPIRGNPASIVVPAGIRSVGRLLDRIGDAVVVNSGSAVKGFAYDSSIQQDWDYPVNISLHSTEKGLLPTFRIKTTPVRTWKNEGGRVGGNPAAPSDQESIEAFLSAGTWAVHDWHSWLERAIVPYFRDFVKRTRTMLQQHAIMDAHIGDYLYAESALVAAKVKDRGGRVHLWPHSTNPVHVDFHDPMHIKSVHAVTRSGGEVWRRAAPGVEVVHDSGLMLDPPAAEVSYAAGEPLSIVVIGGRPIMRHLPILDIAAHEDLYRRFFRGLEPLVNAGRIRVYFKPRGKTGEHETWLERIVGRSAKWERVLQHPLRLSLPNPVFVSLSVGSSALLEGTTRGVPGFIVREGFARDYLATEDGVFDTHDVISATACIGRMTDQRVWEASRGRQILSLTRELESWQTTRSGTTAISINREGSDDQRTPSRS